MLAAALISALSLTAEPAPRPFSCELAPAFGRGTSDLGRIDSFTTVGFDCRYRLFQYDRLSMSPLIGIDRQTFSVRRGDNGRQDLSTITSQDWYVGARIEGALRSDWSLFYTFQSARGHGSLDQTFSNADQAMNREIGSLSTQHLQHALGASYAAGSRLRVSLAWVIQNGEQSWRENAGSLTLQAGTPNGGMSLTEGAAGFALLGESERTRNTHTSQLLQLGVSLSFGEP